MRAITNGGRLLAVASFGIVGLSTAAHAAIVGPYTVDTNTLHLYHLDETTSPAADAAHYAYTGTFTTKPDANQPLNALFGTGSLGNTSRSGFGTAYGSGATPANAGLAGLTPANATTDNVDHTFDHPTTHAFTMEAIIRIDFDPAASINRPMEVIAGEGDAGDSSDRSWQFRLEPVGFSGRTAPALRFQKVSGFGGVGGSNSNYNLDANIPTTGDNAIVQGEWYHIAVTFNGDFANPDNLRLYWTRMADATTSANQIGVGQMNGWLRQQDTDFSIGNELRDFNGNTEGFAGLIDEVRISDIARGAGQMQFVPEPASLTALAGITMMLRRRR